jgi:hypothetical protein
VHVVNGRALRLVGALAVEADKCIDPFVLRRSTQSLSMKHPSFSCPQWHHTSCRGICSKRQKFVYGPVHKYQQIVCYFAASCAHPLRRFLSPNWDSTEEGSMEANSGDSPASPHHRGSQALHPRGGIRLSSLTAYNGCWLWNPSNVCVWLDN